MKYLTILLLSCFCALGQNQYYGAFTGTGNNLTNSTTALPANTNSLVSAAQAAAIANTSSGGGVTTNQIAASWAAGNWFIDAVKGSDTNSGLNSTFPIQTVTNLQAKSYFGATLNFAPGYYQIGSNAPLFLSNDIVLAYGATFQDVLNNSNSTTAVSLTTIAGNAIVRGGTWNSVCTNGCSGIQFYATSLGNGSNTPVYVSIRDTFCNGYSDNFLFNGTWSSPVDLDIQGNWQLTGYDGITGNATASGYGTNSNIVVKNNFVDVSLYNIPTAYQSVINPGPALRGVNGSTKCNVSILGNTFWMHDNTNTLSTAFYAAGWTGASSGIEPNVYIAGNLVQTNSSYGIGGWSGYYVAQLSHAKFHVQGHPYSDSLVSIAFANNFTYEGYTAPSVVNQGTTNASVLSSFTAVFTTPFVDTNYTATETGNGFAIASSYVSSKTTTNCVFNMTAATGLIDWLAVHP